MILFAEFLNCQHGRKKSAPYQAELEKVGIYRNIYVND